jgi:hypothetical protein
MDETVDNRHGVMRPEATTVLKAIVTLLACAGVVCLVVGEVAASPGATRWALAMFTPLLVGAVAATIASGVVLFHRVRIGGDWYQTPTEQQLAAAGVVLVKRDEAPHRNGAGAAAVADDDTSPIPLSDPPRVPIPIRVEDRLQGQLWRASLKILQAGGGYDGFSCEDLGAHGFLMTLPRTVRDWQQSSIMLNGFCISLIEDRQLNIVVFDVNRLEDTAVRSVTSLLLTLDAQTLPEANVRTKLKLTNVSYPLRQALDRYGLKFDLWDRNDVLGACHG